MFSSLRWFHFNRTPLFDSAVRLSEWAVNKKKKNGHENKTKGNKAVDLQLQTGKHFHIHRIACVCVCVAEGFPVVPVEGIPLIPEERGRVREERHQEETERDSAVSGLRSSGIKMKIFLHLCFIKQDFRTLNRWFGVKAERCVGRSHTWTHCVHLEWEGSECIRNISSKHVPIIQHNNIIIVLAVNIICFFMDLIFIGVIIIVSFLLVLLLLFCVNFWVNAFCFGWIPIFWLTCWLCWCCFGCGGQISTWIKNISPPISAQEQMVEASTN